MDTVNKLEDNRNIWSIAESISVSVMSDFKAFFASFAVAFPDFLLSSTFMFMLDHSGAMWSCNLLTRDRSR